MSSSVDFSKMSSAEMKQHFADILAQKELAEKREAEEAARKERERLEEERKELERREQERKEKEERDRKRREEESRAREEQRKRDAAEKAAEEKAVAEKAGKFRRVADSEGESEAESTPTPEGKGKQKESAPMPNVVEERKRRADEFQQARKEKLARILELRELGPENPATRKRKTRDGEEEKAPCDTCEVKGLECVWSENPRETACERCRDKKCRCVVDGCAARVERKRRRVETEGPETPKSKPGPSGKKAEGFPVTGTSEAAVLNRFSMASPLIDIAESLRGIRKTQRGIRKLLTDMAVVQEQQLLSFQNQMTVMSAVLEQFKREYRWRNEMVRERMEPRVQEENGAETRERVDTELVIVEVGGSEKDPEAEREVEAETMREE